MYAGPIGTHKMLFRTEPCRIFFGGGWGGGWGEIECEHSQDCPVFFVMAGVWTAISELSLGLCMFHC